MKQESGRSSKAEKIVIVLGMLTLLPIFSLLIGNWASIRLFVNLSIGCSGLFICFVIVLKKEGDKLGLMVVCFLIVFSMVLRFLMIFVPPIATDDYYRYLWDGKVQYHRLNPYRFAPEDKELALLQSTDLPSKVNHRELKTIYPAVAQIFFLVGYSITGEDIRGFKFLLFLSEAATIVLLGLLLKQLGKGLHLMLVYAVSPLPVLLFMVEGHMDALAFPFVLSALLFFVKRRTTVALIFLGLSISVKLIPLLLVPLFAWQLAGIMNKFKVTLLPILISVICHIPYISGLSGLFETMDAFSSVFYFNNLIFTLLLQFFSNEMSHAIVMIFFLIIYGCIVFSGRLDGAERLIYKGYYIYFVFFLFSPIVHPWYLGWVLIFLPFTMKFSGIFFTGLVNLSNSVYIGYLEHGIWSESLPILIAEYSIVFALLSGELYWRRNFDRKVS